MHPEESAGYRNLKADARVDSNTRVDCMIQRAT